MVFGTSFRRLAPTGLAAGQTAVLVLLLLLSATHTDGSQWSDWSDWSNCSSTCNRGITSKRRECLTENNCTGHSVEFKTCIVKECSTTKKNFIFRDKICSKLDNKYRIDSNFLLWKAYRGSGNRVCSGAQCSSGLYRMYVKDNMDGASCDRDDGSVGICLGEFCAPLSCNSVLGAKDVVSRCLHCPPYKPSQSSRKCTKFFESGNSNSHLTGEIPVGATSIRITCSSCSVVLQTKSSDRVILNKDTQPFTIGGTAFHLLPNSSVFVARGPLLKGIRVEVENGGSNQTSEQSIEYYKLVDGEERLTENGNETVDWKYDEFGPCSLTCGTGLEVAHVHCRDSEFPDKTLPDLFCSSNSPKPFPIVRKCIRPLCPPRWKANDWGICPAICGGGIQRRTVQCIQKDQNGNEIVKRESDCEGAGEKPVAERPCNTYACGIWTTSPWRPCSHSCGDGGSQNRTVTCVDYRGVELNPISCFQLKPPSVQPCNNGPCHYTWRNESWSSCSTSCGNGTQSRLVYCSNQHSERVNESLCLSSTKPIGSKTCFDVQTCKKQWYASPWEECQGSCGSSYQTRKVACQATVSNRIITVSDGACNESLKPAHNRPCNKSGCIYWNEGSWSECSVTCGGGTKQRTVQCINGATGQPATGCDESKKPSETTSCNSSSCNTNCKDFTGYDCNEMKIAHGCNLYFMTVYCCQTCSQS